MPRRPSSKSTHEDDDGGAAKGNERLNRRRRRQIIDIISLPLGIALIIGFLINVQHHLNNKMANKRMRNKILLEHMKGNFQGQNDGDDGNVNHGQRNHRAGYDNDEPKAKHRWIDLRQLPPLSNGKEWAKKYLDSGDTSIHENRRSDFRVKYLNEELWWESQAEEAGDNPPTVDYTKIEYEYPQHIFDPPNDGSYPPLEPMENLFKRWPQEDIDSPPTPFVEKLQHFDFGDPRQMEAALKYRELEVPFKVYNIPEIDAAGEKWTDEYLSYHFDRGYYMRGKNGSRESKNKFGDIPRSSGKAQFSVDSFFAFFIPKNWNVAKMGPPPTMDTDLTFEKWAKHARYADAVGLAPNEVHYYYQSGVPPSERKEPKATWTMISVDLPSFSDPNPTFFSFNPKEQKGIQCRFGERVSCMKIIFLMMRFCFSFLCYRIDLIAFNYRF